MDTRGFRVSFFLSTSQGAVWISSLTPGSLLVKLYVMYKVFAPPLRRVKPIKRNQLRLQPLYNFVLASIVVVIWGLVVTFKPEEVKEQALVGMQDLEPAEECPVNDVFIGLLVLLVAAFTILSAYMSYQTRFISGAFSEARFTALTSYNLILFGGFAYIITQAGAIDVSPSEQMLYITLGIVWVTVFSAVLIVGTRLYAAISGLPFNAHELLLKSRKDSALRDANVKATKSGYVCEFRSAQNGSSSTGDSAKETPWTNFDKKFPTTEEKLIEPKGTRALSKSI